MTLTKRQISVLAVAANRLYNAAHGAPHTMTVGDFKAVCAEAEQMIMHALGRAPYPGDAIPVATPLGDSKQPEFLYCAGHPRVRVYKNSAAE